eukprot:TRINITY_DN46_c0_g1_i2.p2 TRINITY_DN46_c0_g1~~TRINITY_DN46_c0_g1_i2.p2  ORF type:complete len:484 (+),score=247.66 TRINITY_DN46_c0_g1_i2:72-1454(+)
MDAQIQALREENSNLQAQITALREKLGLNRLEDDRERNRIERLFKQYDEDNSGFIDKSEFQHLAGELGIILLPDSLERAIQTIDTSGDGKISFDEFYRWLKADKDLSNQDSYQVRALKIKLQSQAFMRNMTQLTKKLSALPAVPRANNDVLKFKLGVQTAGVDKLKGGFRVNYYNNAEVAAEVNASIDNQGPTCAFIDFLVKDTATDEDVGELVGAITSLLEMAPLNDVAYYGGHNFNLVNLDDGQRVLRVSVWCPVDFAGMASQMLGGEDAFGLLRKLDFGVEFDIALSDFLRENWSPSGALRTRFGIDIEIDSHLFDVLEMFGRNGMGPGAHPAFLFARLLREWSTVFYLRDVDQTAANIPAVAQALEALQGMAGVVPVMLGTAADHGVQMASGLPPPFIPIYNHLVKCIAGPHRVQVQSGNAGIRFDVHGLDVGYFMKRIEGGMLGGQQEEGVVAEF